MSDDYQGTVTRLLDVLKLGDEQSRAEAINKLWSVYIDRLCEVARMTLTSEGMQNSDEESAIISVFDSLNRHAREGRLEEICGRNGLWNCLLNMLHRKATDRNKAGLAENSDESTITWIQETPAIEVFVSREPTSQDVVEIIKWLRRLDDPLLQTVALLRLGQHQDHVIAERLKITQRSVQRKVDLIISNWSKN
jgi:hypothetical protein